MFTMFGHTAKTHCADENQQAGRVYADRLQNDINAAKPSGTRNKTDNGDIYNQGAAVFIALKNTTVCAKVCTKKR